MIDQEIIEVKAGNQNLKALTSLDAFGADVHINKQAKVSSTNHSDETVKDLVQQLKNGLKNNDDSEDTLHTLAGTQQLADHQTKIVEPSRPTKTKEMLLQLDTIRKEMQEAQQLFNIPIPEVVFDDTTGQPLDENTNRLQVKTRKLWVMKGQAYRNAKQIPALVHDPFPKFDYDTGIPVTETSYAVLYREVKERLHKELGRLELEGKFLVKFDPITEERVSSLKQLELTTQYDLTPEQIEHQFELELKDVAANSSIAEGEVFSPTAELIQLKGLPLAERKNALAEYKQKLAAQAQGWAICRERVIHTLNTNPDTSKEDIVKLIQQYSHAFGFAPEQIQKAEAFLAIYEQKHTAIMTTRDQYPIDADLAEATFGRKMKGEVSVIIKPASISFIFSDREEYAYACHGNYSPSFQLTNQMIQGHDRSAGMQLAQAKVHIPSLIGSVIAIKGGSSQEQEVLTIQHENQHAINGMFLDPIGWERGNAPFPVDTINEAPVDQQNAIILQDFREIRATQLTRTMDEIFAFYREGDFTLSRIEETLAAEGGLYDYFGLMKDNYYNFFVAPLGEAYHQRIKNAVQTVFVDEYKTLIHEGIQAVTDLERQGFSKEQVIAMLSLEPLPRWSKVARRLSDKE